MPVARKLWQFTVDGSPADLQVFFNVQIGEYVRSCLLPCE